MDTKKSRFTLAFKVILVILAIVAVSGVALAVGIDDSITLQNCDRDDECATYLNTTSRGQIKWGALIAGGLRSLTNFFVDGKMGVGTLRPSSGEQILRLDVEGAIGAKYYCDENGNNCVAGDDLGGGGDGGNVSLTQGWGIVLSPNPLTRVGTISVASSQVQKRISDYCPTGSAIRGVDDDGNVVCQNTSGSGLSGSLEQMTTCKSYPDIEKKVTAYYGNACGYGWTRSGCSGGRLFGDKNFTIVPAGSDNCVLNIHPGTDGERFNAEVCTHCLKIR